LADAGVMFWRPCVRAVTLRPI